MAIQQSGNVTPGHLAIWTTDNVIQDGGSVPSVRGVLGSLLSADFNTLSDQPILIPATITAFAITGIIVTNAPISLSVAVGGFYPETSKGGVAIVAAGQVYSSLNAASKLLNCTLSAGAQATRYDRANVPDWAIYLSLTNAQGITATADIYLIGVNLTV